MRICYALPTLKIFLLSIEMSFTFEEKEEIKRLVEKREAEIQTEQSNASHSNQQLLDQELEVLMSIVDKIDSMEGGRRRKNRKTRKTRKNRKNRKD